MTQEEIQQGNKLIAEFMGFNVNGLVWWDKSTDTFIDESVSKYHSSWDWIMLVYHKIVINELWGDNNKGIAIFNAIYSSIGDGDDIQKVFYVIIQFIKWHKQQNNHE